MHCAFLPRYACAKLRPAFRARASKHPLIPTCKREYPACKLASLCAKSDANLRAGLQLVVLFECVGVSLFEQCLVSVARA